jgi:hypothetical protein
MTATRKRACVGTVGLLFGPFAFFSLWLLPTECGVRFGLEEVCYLFLFMSVIVGLCFLWYVPIPLVARHQVPTNGGSTRKGLALDRFEPCEGKLSCKVLREAWAG